MRPRDPRRVLGAVLALAAGLSVTGCGKKGPNEPPLRILPSPAKALQVRQVGTQAVLSASLPMRETDGTPVPEPVQVRIMRMPATDTLRPGFVSPRYLQHQFERAAQTIATLSGDSLAKAAPGGRLVYRDPLGPSGSPATPPRLLYNVMILDAQGKRSPLPVPVMVEIAKAPPAPHDLRLETLEGKVRLTWVRGEGGAHQGAFNVYRRAAEDRDEPSSPINPHPIAETTYDDETAVYGREYHYFVREILDKPPAPLESADSPEVEVRPIDIYPPKAPSGVAASAEGTVIRIYWFPNSEPDLGGYRIYRRDSAAEAFAPVGEVGPGETAFADVAAKPGVRYHYVVSAFDSATPPNESPRSEERTEIVPPR